MQSVQQYCNNMTAVIRQICEINHLHYTSSAAVGGGSINLCYAIETVEGKFFLKLNAAADFPAMFIQEAEGLQGLKQAALLKVPEVIACGMLGQQQYLLIEWLEKARPSAGFWVVFAEGLAQLHSITHTHFGWPSSNYIGSLPQSNTYADTWPSFYATQRIMPLIKRLFDHGDIDKAGLKNAEKLAEAFREIFPAEPPALLHGDLWSGNFMAVKDNSDLSGSLASVYDPAVYFGHREMDIGMSLLFGGFDQRFYEMYQYHFPLEKDWKKRVRLTQLYPLLVHAVLFGGSYIVQCKSILNGTGRTW